MNREELLAEMERLAATGDNKAFEAFALQHFKEFPEEVQGKILTGFFSETLEKQAGGAQIAELQHEGMDALERLGKIKEEASKGE